jgi:hypothetical protein
VGFPAVVLPEVQRLSPLWGDSAFHLS